MIKNKFIAVEGLEGAGKTHACCTIKKILNNHNIHNVLSVRQPGSTPISEKIRKLVKNQYHSEKLVKETELLLMYAARIQLVEKIIKPALNNKMWVISDRHNISSLAYQGGGLGIKEDIIIKLHNLFLKNFSPDLTIYLDVFPEIGLNRILKRSSLDSIETRSLNFFKKTREVYLKNTRLDQKIIIINANLNVLEVTKNIENKLINWLKKQSI